MYIDRLKTLKGKKYGIAMYVVLCLITIVVFTLLPFSLWISSGTYTRGITSIRGNSMTPTIEDNQILYVQDTKFERGEIVVAQCPANDKYPISNDVSLLKRIIGLPGETVEMTTDGVLIDGELLSEPYLNAEQVKQTFMETNDINEVVLSEYEYFLLGDNRGDSFDSRHVGAVHANNFLYGLTIECNSHTYKIVLTVVLIAIINLLCIAFLMVMAIPYVLAPQVHVSYIPERHKTNIANRDQGSTPKKPQPKSKKNQKKAFKVKKEQQKAQKKKIKHPNRKKKR